MSPSRHQRQITGSAGEDEFVSRFNEEFITNLFPRDFAIDGHCQLTGKTNETVQEVLPYGFYIQVKSSQHFDSDGPVCKQIEKEHLRYWVDLNIPVVLLYYDREDDDFFYRFVHSYFWDELGGGSNTLEGDGTKQICIDRGQTLESGDELAMNTRVEQKRITRRKAQDDDVDVERISVSGVYSKSLRSDGLTEFDSSIPFGDFEVEIPDKKIHPRKEMLSAAELMLREVLMADRYDHAEEELNELRADANRYLEKASKLRNPDQSEITEDVWEVLLSAKQILSVMQDLEYYAPWETGRENKQEPKRCSRCGQKMTKPWRDSNQWVCLHCENEI